MTDISDSRSESDGRESKTRRLIQFSEMVLEIFPDKAAEIEEIQNIYRTFKAHLGVGGSTNSPTIGSLFRAMLAMDLNKDSVLLDLGSGYGMVLFMGKLLFDVKSVLGVEVREDAVDFTRKEIDRLRKTSFLPDECDCPTGEVDIGVWHQDITAIPLLPFSVTHIYAFDCVFTPDVTNFMSDVLMHTQKRWKVFLSTWNKSYWEGESGLVLEPFVHPKWAPRGRAGLSLTVSGEGHSIWLYRNALKARYMPKGNKPQAIQLSLFGGEDGWLAIRNSPHVTQSGGRITISSINDDKHGSKVLFTLGRRDFVRDFPYRDALSRKHFSLCHNDDGGFFLINHSVNGTWVSTKGTSKERLLWKDWPHVISDGDEVQFLREEDKRPAFKFKFQVIS